MIRRLPSFYSEGNEAISGMDCNEQWTILEPDQDGFRVQIFLDTFIASS
jgi:hypothetical protein